LEFVWDLELGIPNLFIDMALPEQVIERLSREPLVTPGWSGRLLMFAGTVFFLSLAVYVGLTYGYKPYLNAQVNDLDGQIQRFNQEIPASDQEQLTIFYSQLANLDGMLKGHIDSSSLFEWLEVRTQSNIAFSKLAFSARNGQLALNGAAKTMDDFAEQLAIFQQDPSVQRINVNSLTASANNAGWQFDMMLFLDPAFATQPPASAPAPAVVPVSSSTPAQASSTQPKASTTKQ
jgi:hypothetical protein